MDVEEGKEKLQIVGAMAQRMWDASPYDVKIHLTTDRRKALKNADFVTTQFRVGLLNARIKDERIPLSYGMIGQETNGAGGIFKALRTIPVILDIVKDMKEVCPNAWLINFTNPSGMITEAVIRYGKWNRVIGLCNVPVTLMIDENKLLEKQEGALTYRFAGLNHFHWHRIFDEQGVQITDEVIEKIISRQHTEFIPANIFDIPQFPSLLRSMKLIPCPYHNYYFRSEDMLQHELEEYNHEGTRAEQVKKTETELFELYKDPNLNYKPAQLEKRGGTYYSDAACETIVSIYTNKQSHMVVSTKNIGSIPDLPSDCVVEVSAYIGSTGANPIAFGEFPSAEKGLLQLMKQMELTVCEAAVYGDYGLLMEAFFMNPLIPAGENAKRVMDELLIAHKKYLPQFKQAIERLQEKHITIKDELAARLS